MLVTDTRSPPTFDTMSAKTVVVVTTVSFPSEPPAPAVEAPAHPAEA